MKKIYSFGIFLLITGLVNTYYQFGQLPLDYYKKRTADLIIVEEGTKNHLMDRYFKDIQLLIKKKKYKEAIKKVELSQNDFNKSGVPKQALEKQKMIKLQLYLIMGFNEYYENGQKGLPKMPTNSQNDYLLKAEVLLKKINNQRLGEPLEEE